MIDINNLKKFQEDVKNITVFEMKNLENNRELTKIYVLLGDLLSMIRTPNFTPFKKEMDENRMKKSRAGKKLEGNRL